MYHISSDKRSYESAVVIRDTLDKLLQHSKLDQISVSLLCKEAGVSRPTFYRLFDNTSDILRWYCDCSMQALCKALEQSTTEETWPFCFNLRYILEHPHTMEMVCRAGRLDIADSSFCRYMTEMLEPKRVQYNLSKADMQLSALVVCGIISATMTSWINDGKKESVDQLYERVRAIICNIC